ncbi:uncharacterized protein LOC120850725 [Ixodes scapularis]|uniref:uncharacterized protein LOC120850725 n=1 Tax=Ixodes scapularis TaxID=6945 RepID=UPI001A9E0FDB|nr:uncharacterized protein LOC120850725 [Ixodes scapularis]
MAQLPQPAVAIPDNIFSGTLRDTVLKKPGRANNSYSEDVRKFALTLHFFSAKAYKFLRKHVKLPHPCALRKWAAMIGAKPGFTKGCFEKVFQEAQKGLLLISLMVDEISIKKQADCESKRVVGYCDLGHGILKDDCNAYAKHALVFLAVAVNRNWKVPLG